MQTLLGPLEQQEVNVAKAGLVSSLPARTSLLAAANPAGGQYNRAKTLLQNLKMSAAMLSRFDIIFVLLDQPDQRRDERLSEHVMAMHSGEDPLQHPSTYMAGDQLEIILVVNAAAVVVVAVAIDCLSSILVIAPCGCQSLF